MDCQHLHRNTGLVSLWRRRRCPHCRAAQAIDKIIAHSVAQMQVEPAPASGQARALAGLTALFPPLPRSRRRPFWRCRALPAGVFTAGLAAAGYGWVCWSDMDPNVHIPAHAMPAVNAFDTLRSASAALVDAKQVGWALANRPGSGRKPAPGKKPPLPSLAAGGKPRDPLADLTGDHVYTLREKIALLQRDAGALALLRKGLQEAYEAPTRSWDTDISYLNGYRNLARLLALEQQVREARGDWNGAVNSGLDVAQLGEQIMHGEGLSGTFTGMAFAGIGRKQIWQELPHLDAAQARAAARRLARIVALQVPPADTIQEQKRDYVMELEHIFHSPGWRLDFLSTSQYHIVFNQESRVFSWLRLLPYSKRRILDQGLLYMDRQIASARRPYSDRPSGPPIPDDPVNAMMLPAPDTLRLENTDDRTQNNLLLAAALLQAYRRDHGAYPAALSQLAPRYLQAVPDDPFAPQGPLRYRRQGTTTVLYSIGPDGIDQQGTPIKDMRNDLSDRYDVTSHCSGDIVAGINF